MTIITPPEVSFSWTPVLEDMKEGSEIETPEEFAKTIRQRISREIKLKYPDRQYKTTTEEKPGIIIIRRIK